MIGKNEITLEETKNGRHYLRLVVSETGHVPPIHNWHYCEVKHSDSKTDFPVIQVDGLTPTQLLRENDYVIERVTEGDKFRYELSIYYGGRLRSLSLANNLGTYTKIVTSRREIYKWFEQRESMNVWVNRLFPNQTYQVGDSMVAVIGQLRQYFPGDFMQSKDSLGFKTDELIYSCSKFYRLLTKKNVDYKHHQVTRSLTEANLSDERTSYVAISKDNRNSKPIIKELPEAGTRVVEIKLIGWAVTGSTRNPIYELSSFIYQPE